MVGGMRNVGPRRTHRERGQPGERQKLGLLEKRKDYRLRARDYHRKQDALKTLREKAEFKNPEEFYHGMITAGTKSKRRTTADYDKNAPKGNKEEHALALAHDVGYVAAKRNVERARIHALKSELHFTAAAASAETSSLSRKRVVFDDDGKVVRNVNDDVGGDGGAGDAGLRKAQLGKQSRGKYKELEDRLERERRLRTLMVAMETERNLMDKGRRFRVKEADPFTGEPAVYRWRPQRKR